MRLSAFFRNARLNRGTKLEYHWLPRGLLNETQMNFNFRQIMKTTLTNKRSSRLIRILFSAALLLLAISLHAQPFTRYDAQPAGSKVTLAGDSSIHKWTMEGTIIGGFLEIDSAVKIDTAEKTIAGLTGGKVNTRAQVSIPIRSIKSGK